MMRYIVAFSLIFSLVASLWPASVSAAACSYESTQARVQRNIRDPWKQRMSIREDETFRVGSFHNGTGQFTSDSVIEIVNPKGESFRARNEQVVKAWYPGTYRVHVSTPGQWGYGCSETAYVYVNEVEDRDRDGESCQYQSTQARVQRDITDPWKRRVTVRQYGGFNVGSFHNGTGVFAEDTRLRVIGPGVDGFFENGDRVWVRYPGWYTLKVRTEGKTGGACRQKAEVYAVPWWK